MSLTQRALQWQWWVLGNLVIVLLLALNAQQESKAQLEHQAAKQEQLLAQIVGAISRELITALLSVQELARNPAMVAYADNQSPTARAAMTELLTSEVRRRPELIRQIRYIDESGIEQARVRISREGAVEQIPINRLQDKSDRYYFRAGALLGPNAVYVSYLDLNMEYGEVERPYRPTMRLIRRIFDTAGTPQGMVVINTRGNRFLDPAELLAATTSDYLLWVADDTGRWLVGPSSELDWSSMTPGESPDRVINYDLELWSLLQSGERAIRSRTVDDVVVESFTTIDLQRDLLPSDSITESGVNRRWHAVLRATDQVRQRIFREAYLEQIPELLLILGLSVLGYSMLQSRHRYRQALQQERERQTQDAQFVMDLVPDPLLIIDQEGMVVGANDPACELLKYSQDALMGRSVDTMVPDLSRDAHRNLRLGYMMQPKRVTSLGNRVLHVMNSNGKKIPVSISLNFQRLSDGMRVVCILTPATEKTTETPQMTL